MRILLVLPRDSTYRCEGSFKRSLSYAPLTLTTLAALVPAHLRAQIDIVDEGVQRWDPGRRRYDVAGITCVASSAPRAYALAASLRAAGARVVLGGAHPTLNPEEAAGHADAVVAGFAERAWPELLESIHAGRPLPRIARDDAPDPVQTPTPRRDLLPRGVYLGVPTVLTSRGCSNACSFCSIPRIWQGQRRPRPVDEVVEEIRALRSRRILFLDPNLMADRDHARALFEALIPLRVRWGGLATIDLAEDRELLDLAARSGAIGILVGFESVRSDNLGACGKPVRDVSRYREAVRALHGRGIGVLGCFVFGFDGDDADVFNQTLAFIDDVGIDLPRFAVLTPFPGTPLFTRMRRDGRILCEDWSRYDTERVVFQPAHMTPEALQEGLARTWRAAYSGRRVLGRAARAGRWWPLALASNLGFRHYAARVSQRTGAAA